MAKVKIQAGAEIDTLNKTELDQALRTTSRDWFQQVARGDRYRRFSAKGTIAAAAVSIGGADQADAVLGPAEGFVWAVQRVGVHGLTTYPAGTTEAVRLYVNDEGPSSLVHPALLGYVDFGPQALILYPGDVLLLAAADLAATGTVTLTGQAREVPMPLAWRLGG